ncbi:MAG: DUF805 domain-containing protein [Alistipes sp.]
MKWFIKCIKNYATFRGRARRAEYWYFVLFTIILLIIATLLDYVCFGSGSIGVFQPALGLFLFLPSLAVQVRRLHDTGKSGLRILWYYLFTILWGVAMVIIGGAAVLSNDISALSGATGFLAVMGIGCLVMLIWGILFLVWYCTNGDKGDNKYGADPKES